MKALARPGVALPGGRATPGTRELLVTCIAMSAKRNIDPEVVKIRGRLGTAVRIGDTAGEKRYRQELHDLNIVVEAKKIVARAKGISPVVLGQVRTILLAALDVPCSACGEDRYVLPAPAECREPQAHIPA